MSKYILVDVYDHDELKGKPKYFKSMTAIGPSATPNIDEAEMYDTEDEAKFSPAHRHWSSNWQVAPHNPLTQDKEKNNEQ